MVTLPPDARIAKGGAFGSDDDDIRLVPVDESLEQKRIGRAGLRIGNLAAGKHVLWYTARGGQVVHALDTGITGIHDVLGHDVGLGGVRDPDVGAAVVGRVDLGRSGGGDGVGDDRV